LTAHSHLYLTPSGHRGHLAVQTDIKPFVILFNQSFNASFPKLGYTNWSARPTRFDAQDIPLRNSII